MHETRCPDRPALKTDLGFSSLQLQQAQVCVCALTVFHPLNETLVIPRVRFL